MSISSEITRITNNVQNTIDTIEATGVTVPEGANSDDLPGLAADLANEKQDKLTGTQGQVVGFDEDGNAVPQDAGVTSFNGRTGAVTPQSGDYTAEMVGARPSTWTPSAEDVGAIPATEKGAASGVATLGTDGKVPAGQLPEMDYVPNSEVGVAGGVAELDSSGKVPVAQLPILTFGAQSVATSAWAADTTYEGWGFRAALALSGVTADYVPSVTFGIADATGGNLAPVAETYAGGVYIYAKGQPTTAVSVTSVVCVKGV